jgi:hypothetical protein
VDSIDFAARANVEAKEGWREFCSKIPRLCFQEDWEIHMIPPWAGAMLRFEVVYGTAYVSVYLDVYDSLGIVGQPYWEVYPLNGGDTFRCFMDDTDTLLAAISDSIYEQNVSSSTDSVKDEKKKVFRKYLVDPVSTRQEI